MPLLFRRFFDEIPEAYGGIIIRRGIGFLAVTDFCTRCMKEYEKMTKIGIEIFCAFVYNVFIVVLRYQTVRGRHCFPKGVIFMYTVNAIRNICLLGHSGSGKSALAESLLYMTGAIDRMGKNADGNTVCDFDPEEIRRNISISTAVVPLEYHNTKINVLDTPGGFDFSGAVMEALRAADAAVLVLSAKDGITVGFEKAWKYCEERNMPRFVYISRLTKITLTIMPLSTHCVRSMATRSRPLWFPFGTQTARSPASSMC